LDLEHMKPPKYSYITRSEIYLNQNLPTNFFEEPNFLLKKVYESPG
jgi:hypothetical protein